MSDDKTGLIKRVTELEARLAAAEARIAMLEALPSAVLPPIFRPCVAEPAPPPLGWPVITCGRGETSFNIGPFAVRPI